MSESWLKLTDKERETRIYNIAKNETGLSNFNEQGVLRGFLRVITSVVNSIYLGLAELLLQANLDTATGLFLSMWGILIGVYKKPAKKALRYFTGYSYSSGTIKADAWIVVDGTDLRFKTTEDVRFEKDTSFLIKAGAEFEGTRYNISGNYTLRFTKVINGLDRLVIPENPVIENGVDEEAEEEYRTRIKEKWKSLGDEAPPSKYFYIAKSITGVDDVKIKRTPRGSGSLDIILSVTEGMNENDVILEVESAVNEKIGVCRNILVLKANPKPVNLTVKYIGSVTEGELTLLLDEFFRGRIIGVTKTIISLYNFLFNSLKDKISSLIITPNQDMTAGEYEYIVMGTLTVIKE
jgi:uncharacterized phage protein gp47/JayE